MNCKLSSSLGRAFPKSKKITQTLGIKKTSGLRWFFFILGGETGIRTPATVARRQFSKLLHYHSGTSPKSRLGCFQSGHKVTIKHCENNKNPYLTDSIIFELSNKRTVS
jgi:hypothetical protein